MEFPIAAGLVLVTLLAFWLFYWYRPPEMSEVTMRHFKSGFLFAAISSVLLFVVRIFLWSSVGTDFAAHFPGIIVLVGNLCNLISIFCFFMELLPGGEITPEGMTVGLVMCLEQIHWLLVLLAFALKNGF